LKTSTHYKLTVEVARVCIGQLVIMEQQNCIHLLESGSVDVMMPSNAEWGWTTNIGKWSFKTA